MEGYAKAKTSNQNSTIKNNIVNYTYRIISAFSTTIARKITMLHLRKCRSVKSKQKQHKKFDYLHEVYK